MGSFGRDGSGVSSVIGTVLMLGITVSVFAGVSLVVLEEVGASADADRADLDVLAGESTLLLRHQGGDRLALSGGHALVNIGGTEYRVDLADFAADTENGEHWAIGDSLCVGCLFPGADVDGVLVVHGGTVMLSHGERGQTVAGAAKDLHLSAVSVQPDTPYENGPTTFTASIENSGIQATPASTVGFLLDGAPLEEVTIPALAVGDSVQVTSSAWAGVAGDHTILAVVDPADALGEASEDNNEAETDFTVGLGTPDPGAPFEDTNENGLFVDGTDILLTVGDIAGGTYDAGANGLVIPPSVGALSAATWDIDGAGTHRIRVDLTATTGDLRIDSAAGIIATGITLTTDDPAAILHLAGATRVDVAGSTLNAADRMEIDSATGDTDVTGATLTASGFLYVRGDQDVHAEGASLTGGALTYAEAETGALQAADITITSTGHRAYLLGTSIDATDASVTAASWARVWATGTDLDATGAQVLSTGDHAIAGAEGDTDVTGASIEGPLLAYVFATTGDVTADQASVQAGTGAESYAYLIATAGTVQATGLDLDAYTLAYVSGADGVAVQDADLNGRGGEVSVAAQADVDVQRTTLRADTIRLDGDATGNIIFVQDACFLDSGGSGSGPIIEPRSITVDGTPACGSLPVHDPGFPYEDTNGDASYTPGIDQELAPADVVDGQHDAGSNGLVIPASVGPISANRIQFTAQGDSYVGVDLTASNNDLTLMIGGGLELDGVTLAAMGNNRDLHIQHGGLSAQGLIAQSRGHIIIQGGDTDLAGADLETLQDNKAITIDSTGDIEADGAGIASRGNIALAAAGGISASGATTQTLLDHQDLTIAAGQDVDLQASDFDLRGHFTLSGDDIHLEGMDLALLTNDKDVQISAASWLHGDGDTTISARGFIDLQAGDMRVEGITVTMLTNDKDLTWTSGGLLDADDMVLETRGRAIMTATGDLYLQRAQLTGLVDGKEFLFTANDIHFQDSDLSNNDELIANVGGTVFVDGATFDDDNDALDVEPDGQTSGTPASGGLE